MVPKRGLRKILYLAPVCLAFIASSSVHIDSFEESVLAINPRMAVGYEESALKIATRTPNFLHESDVISCKH